MGLAECIREVPDYPRPGLAFKDITTLLKDPEAFRDAVDLLARGFEGERVGKVVATEARGFLLGAPLAYVLGCGFVPVRKAGKLPCETVQATYQLEYGSDAVELHTDAISPGDRVLIVDDLLATGGTMGATVELVERMRGEIVGLAFLVELESLGGRATLRGYRVETLVTY